MLFAEQRQLIFEQPHPVHLLLGATTVYGRATWLVKFAPIVCTRHNFSTLPTWHVKAHADVVVVTH